MFKIFDNFVKQPMKELAGEIEKQDPGLAKVIESASVVAEIVYKKQLVWSMWAAAIAMGIVVGAGLVAIYYLFWFQVRIAEVRADQYQMFSAFLQGRKGQVAGEIDLNQKVDIELTGNIAVLGDENVPVTIVEYSDFNCQYCQKFFTETLPRIKSEYVDTGKVKFIYRHFPFLGLESERASLASACAQEQGKFWEAHNLFFTKRGQGVTAVFSDVNLKKYARELSLNTTDFNTCLNSGKYQEQVNQELAEGRKHTVTGTPTLFVNGLKLVGALPFESFKSAIEEALAENK